MHIALAGPIQVEMFRDYLGLGPAELKLLPKGQGGIPVNQIAGLLLKLGYKVTLCSLEIGIDDRLEIDHENLKIIFGPLRKQHLARDFYRREVACIQEMLSDSNADIVHAHWTYEYALGALQSGIPTLVTVHDWAPAILRLNLHPAVLIRTLMNFAVLIRGRYFTAVSPYIEKKFAKFKPCAIIPNAVNDASFVKVKETRDSRPNRIVSISSEFGKGKNVRTLLRAFALMLGQNPGLVLQLVGKGFEREGVAEQWAQARQLTRNVEFLGFQAHEEVEGLIQNAALLIHPSREESFGMTLVEAMAKRTPVVAGQNSGAVPWVLDNGKAGILTDINDPVAIAREALRILGDPSLWFQYSERGYNHAYKHFRLSAVVDQYIAEYEKVLALESKDPTFRTPDSQF